MEEDYGHPRTLEFWKKLSLVERVALTVARDMRIYQLKSDRRFTRRTKEILRHAEIATSEDFGDIRTDLCKCISGYLETNPEATVPEVLLHIATSD